MAMAGSGIVGGTNQRNSNNQYNHGQGPTAAKNDYGLNKRGSDLKKAGQQIFNK